MVRVVAVAVALGAVACSGGDDDVDRASAVQAVVDDSAGLLTEEQAGCYVDRVVDELGPRLLTPDAEPTDAELRRLTAIRVDCIGVANLGAGPRTTGTAAMRVPPRPGPMTFGDDPALDELWAACEGGDGGACDQLFDVAPLGSDYEAFGATCGGRGAEPSCGAVYPAPTSSPR